MVEFSHCPLGQYGQTDNFMLFNDGNDERQVLTERSFLWRRDCNWLLEPHTVYASACLWKSSSLQSWTCSVRRCSDDRGVLDVPYPPSGFVPSFPRSDDADIQPLNRFARDSCRLLYWTIKNDPIKRRLLPWAFSQFDLRWEYRLLLRCSPFL